MTNDNTNTDQPSAVNDAATAKAESAAKEELSKEELLKRKIEELRKRDPFVYR